MFTILVVGAGYVGSEIAKRFAADQQKVFAITRSSKRHSELSLAGIVPFCADIARSDFLKTKIRGVHFVVFCAAPERHDPEAYKKIYFDGLQNVIEMLSVGQPPKFFVYLSSDKVWGRHVDGWVDESTPADPDTPQGEILAAAEKRILGSGIPAAVLRLSGVYGPGRNRIASLRTGEWPVPGPDRYLNMIHRDDIAGNMRTFFNRAKPGEVYIGTDSEPTPLSEIYRWLCEKTGTPPRHDFFDKGPVQGIRCRNAKFKELGAILRYPSFRVGYDELIQRENPNGWVPDRSS